MREVRFYGDPRLGLDWLETEGWTVLKNGQDGSTVLICTFDNQATDPLERLEGTIVPMRNAMNHVQQGSVKCVVLVTDGSGYAGTRQIPESEKSATFVDEHGLGSLTSEILASIAKKAGASVTIIRGIPELDASVRGAILEALE